MGNRYAPEAAARGLKAQNNATSPHGPGTVPTRDPSGSRGCGMDYKPAKAASCLNEWGRASDAPSNSGPMKSY